MMHDDPSASADRTRADERFADTDGPADPPSNGSPDLEAKTVGYPDRPDRCTIHPPGLSGIERMERWLTVDTRAIVDLEAWR